MRRLGWIVGVVILVSGVIGLAFNVVRAPVGPSSLSRGGDGWWVFARYVETRGHRVERLDRPLELPLGEGTVLVATFPFHRALTDDGCAAFEQHLRAGGTLLLAYSGEARPGPSEKRLLDHLDLVEQRRDDPVPWLPWIWRRQSSAEWRLVASTGARVVIRAPLWWPAMPEDAEPLLTAPDGQVVAFGRRDMGGRTIVIPAQVLANGRLGSRGNADFMESLIRGAGTSWLLDEFHHGLTATIVGGPAQRVAVFDLLLLHLAALYGLALAALARRFGVPWRPDPTVAGSTAKFLIGLGALHDRLGHHAAAARLLVERTREFDRSVVLPDGMLSAAASVDRSRFLAFAGEVARLQRTSVVSASTPKEG